MHMASLVLEILVSSENRDNFINLERSSGEESEALKDNYQLHNY